MLIYLTLALVPIGLGLVFPNINSNKRDRVWFFAICGTVMLFFMGCRHYSLGSVDTYNYYRAMTRAIESASWEKFFEPDLYEAGTQVFIYALSRVFSDPQWLLVITSLIYIVSMCYFAYHNTDDIPIALMAYITLGLMQFHLQGMRQSIAMCICLFAYEQAKRKHLIRFILLVMLATVFHQTAVVFLPVYFVSRMKYRKRNNFLIIGVSVAALMLSPQIINIANSIFNKEYSTPVTSGGFVAVTVYLIVIAFAFLYYHKKGRGENASLLYILVVSFACYLMRYISAQAAERISFYFVFPQMALLATAIKMTMKKDRKLMLFLIVFLSVGLFAYRLAGSEFVPYRFFWE